VLPGYQDLSGRQQAALLALSAVIALDVASVISGWLEIGLMERILDGESITKSEVDSNDARQGVLAIGQFVLYLVTAVVFIRWFHRAYVNLGPLGARRRHGDGWAIGGWFVPILSWWRPKEIANDLWWGSAPEEERGLERSDPLLLIWWLGFTATQMLGQALFRGAFGDSDTAEGLRSQDYAYLVSDLLDIAVAVLAILVIRRITERMDVRAAARAPAPA
jgi:hypothetical protein